MKMNEHGRAQRRSTPRNPSLFVEYYPLHMKFNDEALEKTFRDEFTLTQTKIDFLWSLITGFLSVVALIKTCRIVGDDECRATALQVALSVSGSLTMCILTSLPSKRAYLALRTPLVMALRGQRMYGIVSTQLPRRDRNPTGLRRRFPPFTLPWLLWAVAVDSASVALLGFTFRHVSLPYILVTVLALFTPVHAAMNVCRAEPPPGRAGPWSQAISGAVGRVRGLMHGALPVGVWSTATWPPSQDSPAAQERSCITFYIWLVTTFGYLVPWALSVCLEEAQRWDFLVRRGHYRLPARLGRAVLHGAAVVALGAQALWMALDTASVLL